MLTLGPAAARAIRAAITVAGGREVCFVADVEGDVVQTARVVARGDSESVLALPGFAARGQLLVHNHPSGGLDPSDADLSVAARMFQNGVGFAITDNQASRLYVVTEIPSAKPAEPVTPADIDAVLGPDGLVARELSRFEDRPSQRALATEIARLYADGGVGLLEAGTGVGKSLGYLVPALRWSHRNGERTIVSTATINLQEQLVGKDLPFLARALDDQPVRFALLKGWRNYVCLLRLGQARGAGQSLFDASLAEELDAIAAWAERTADGSIADLPAPPRPEVWDEVAAEGDLCQRLKCPAFGDCFVFKARRAAAEADVIVVNHHLLMADLAVRRVSENWDDAAVLPAFTRLVVDEGHHLEDAAAAHLGASISKRALARLFNRLDRRGKGLLPALVAKLVTRHDLLSVASLDLGTARLAPAVQAARDEAERLFELLERVLDEAGESTHRLTERFASHAIWGQGLQASLDQLLREFALVADGLRLVQERLETEREKADALAPLLAEVRGVVRRRESAGDALRRALVPASDPAPHVRWLEVRGAERNVLAHAVPLELAGVLRDDLFGRLKTTVVTSATLTADQGFGFLARRLGLGQEQEGPEPATGQYPSPFDYPRQALCVVPTDVPAPNLDAAGHFGAVLRILRDLVTASDGGVFALFTSHRDVRQAAAEWRAAGLDTRWPLLVHGEASRDQLVTRFRDLGSAVLVGTASFWEGVDVPGRALRGLLLAKLPFRVPSEPVTAAQCEAIEARGGDAFAEYSLPFAALRLKQGFGRLIRSRDDRGVVVIADSRLVSKQYGRKLLAGLPPARRLTGAWQAVKGEVERFYVG
ncbi:MAG: helicase C-terminal domain-containing protein [Gemmatimonadota bacterium]